MKDQDIMCDILLSLMETGACIQQLAVFGQMMLSYYQLKMQVFWDVTLFCWVGSF